MMEAIGWVTTVLAVSGVVLNNRMDRRCFWLWMISNAISGGLHAEAGMTALMVRDAVFLALAVHGYRSWGRTRLDRQSFRNGYLAGQVAERMLNHEGHEEHEESKKV